MNLIGRHEPGAIHINGRRLAAPFVVAPGFLLDQWIGSAEQLVPECLEPVWAQAPRVVLVGGAALPAAQLRPLRTLFAGRQVALEPMDTGAACRTYNVLAQEDRAVVALLFP